MSGDNCPGPRLCYALNGTAPCRVHGCRVCGSAILFDTNEWPAPLCVAHAPEELIDYASDARRALRGLVEYFDGTHAPDCAVFLSFGRSVSDDTIRESIRGGVRPCSCGGFAVREGARIHFRLEGRGVGPLRRPRDTDRAPPPAETRSGLVNALERTLGEPVELGRKGRVN